MEKKELKIGDVVELNSGGPDMTVFTLEEGHDLVGVIWFDRNHQRDQMHIQATCLKKSYIP